MGGGATLQRLSTADRTSKHEVLRGSVGNSRPPAVWKKCWASVVSSCRLWAWPTDRHPPTTRKSLDHAPYAEALFRLLAASSPASSVRLNVAGDLESQASLLLSPASLAARRLSRIRALAVEAGNTAPAGAKMRRITKHDTKVPLSRAAAAVRVFGR